jgi:hypothetical protein
MTPNKNAGIFLLLDLQPTTKQLLSVHPDRQLCLFLEEKQAIFRYSCGPQGGCSLRRGNFDDVAIEAIERNILGLQCSPSSLGDSNIVYTRVCDKEMKLTAVLQSGGWSGFCSPGIKREPVVPAKAGTGFACALRLRSWPSSRNAILSHGIPPGVDPRAARELIIYAVKRRVGSGYPVALP